MRVQIKDGRLKELVEFAKRNGDTNQDALERLLGLRDCPEGMVWSKRQAEVILMKFQLDVKWQGKYISIPFEGEVS